MKDQSSSTYVLISPHSDDIAYSAFSAALEPNTRKVIVNVFGQSCWTFQMAPDRNLAEEVSKIRGQEEEEFASLIGAELILLGFRDSSLRYPKFGAEYEKKATDDPDYSTVCAAIVDTLKSLPYEAIVYAPLGVSGHLDHLICRDAVLSLPAVNRHRCRLYEDLPYVASWNDRQIEEFAATLSARLRPHLSATVASSHKTDAIRVYPSQLEPMTIETIIEYGERLSGRKGMLVERFWAFAPVEVK